MSGIKTPKIPSGRLAEVFLLLIGLSVSCASYFSILVNRTGTLPSSYLLHLGILGLFALATHLAVRYFAPYADPILLPTAITLNGIGVAMIFRLDIAYKLSKTGPVVGYKQLLFSLIGILLMLGFMMSCRYLLGDYRRLRAYTYTSMVAALGLLLSPLLPVIGRNINGARIWINIGFSIQPSELAKICLAIFFAGYLMMYRDALSTGGKKLFNMRLPRIRDLGPLVLVWIFSLAILVFEKDLGTSLLIFGLFVAMLYVATNQISWILLGAAMFAPAVFVAAKTFRHVQVRINTWLYPYDPKFINGQSHQLVQGQFGMADGGLLGNGWAQGSPSVTPYANSDFIYASLGEELGLLGLAAILLLYLLLVQRGFVTAMLINDSFGKLLATGLAFTIGWQVFVVVGGITRVIPLTGLTLPFVASGGSSLIANWLIIGILLVISHEARKPKEKLSALVDTKELEILLDKQAQKRYQDQPAHPPRLAASPMSAGAKQLAPSGNRSLIQAAHALPSSQARRATPSARPSSATRPAAAQAQPSAAEQLSQNPNLRRGKN